VLLRTIFILALLGVLGETIAHGAAALAGAALRERAVDAVAAAFASGTRSAQAVVAQTLASNPQASTFPVPSPTSTCAYGDASGCAIAVTTIFATPTPPPSNPVACPQTGCTVMLQANTAVSEARASFVISSVANGLGGAELAARSQSVSFRTFATPPYATIVGGADSTLDSLASDGPGDDGGAPNSLISVEYDPSGTGAPSSGNVWRPLLESWAAPASAWDP
jgi:hypothetical protein